MPYSLLMTNNTTPLPTDPFARLARFSKATPTINMPDRPARRLPPKSRRHSVKHRAIR